MVTPKPVLGLVWEPHSRHAGERPVQTRALFINFNAPKGLPWAYTERLFFCCWAGTTLTGVEWNGIWCHDYRAQSPGGGVSGSWPTNTHPIVSNVQHETGSEVMKVTHVLPEGACRLRLYNLCKWKEKSNGAIITALLHSFCKLSSGYRPQTFELWLLRDSNLSTVLISTCAFAAISSFSLCGPVSTSTTFIFFTVSVSIQVFEADSDWQTNPAWDYSADLPLTFPEQCYACWVSNSLFINVSKLIL